MAMTYHLQQVTTNFSFLRGGSHPEELVLEAASLGYSRIAITDRNTLAGVVRAYAAAKKLKNIQVIVGVRLDLMDGPSLLAYPVSRDGYAKLSALLSAGNLRTEKGKCEIYKADVYAHAHNLKFIVVPPGSLNAAFDFEEDFKRAVAEYREALGLHLHLGATFSYAGDDGKKLYRLSQLAAHFGMPMIATNDVHYHHPSRRELQDVITCIREKCTIHEAGYRLAQNAERHLKSSKEMERLFSQYSDAIWRTEELADACQFSLGSLEYVYPEEITTEGRTPQEELAYHTWAGAREEFGEQIPQHLENTLHDELNFIERKNYAAYFLTVFDIVRYARAQKILCQGRGSAANSLVCFCLGITSVDPTKTKTKLLFARFMSDARNEPPDIDVDFEHERREEVIQYIYDKYGRDRAAIVATVTQLHQKGAIRDVGKAMGISVDAISRLSKMVWGWGNDALDRTRVTEQGFNLTDPYFAKVLQLTDQFMGFPRQLGQHTGGFVMTQGKITDLCPILNARMEGRTCIEWDKDDIEVLGFLKVDVLALGMLTCIRKAFDLLATHYNIHHTLASIPQEDPAVYDMICRADTIGVFQIESRAQMSMLPRLKPRTFYDLVIEVAIVRPGPIQGDMVHPYLRRREGKETVEYPKKELEDILERTLGVPLFQEQAMEIAIVAAGFSPAEADELRRSMATFKAKGKVDAHRDKLVDGMVARGYERAFAERVFKQLEGFGSYGFPESHAASFALLVYVSSWIKCKHPDVFACALLNSQPMGFYQPAQIVQDARRHGVEVRPMDVNLSMWDYMLEKVDEDSCALRIGFSQGAGLSKCEMAQLIEARGAGYSTIVQIAEAGISLSALEKLADADAFRSLGLDRRQALWEISALADRPTGVYIGQSAAKPEEQSVELPAMHLAEHVVQDYSSTSVSLKAHPVHFLRDKLAAMHVCSTANLADLRDGTLLKVAGLVLIRQRPGTAKGVCFITIEDECGTSNLVVFENIFSTHLKTILQARLLMVEGKLQREGDVTHVVVHRCHDLSAMLGSIALSTEAQEALLTLSRADIHTDSGGDARTQPKRVIQAEIFGEGRNFR
jgi:error-prone DNA polymerase